MKINDDYLKEQLKHVYWLNGGPCAGKTAMTNMLIENHGFQTLKEDVLKYRLFTTSKTHPAMQMPNPDLNYQEWFNRPTDIHSQWLSDLVEEMMPFFIIDLLKMEADQPIVIDLGIMPECILPFIPKERILCLYTLDTEIERLYFFREDHKMILDCINNNTVNPKETIAHSNQAMIKFSNDVTKACIAQGIQTIKRTPNMSKERQFGLVCNYFGLESILSETV